MIPANWPFSPGAYEAFVAIRRSGFTVYCCGDKRDPYVLVATYDRGDYIDLISIRDED